MNNFTILNKLGAGAYGDVFKVKNKEGKEYALKKVELEDFDEFGELDILSRFRHPQLLHLEEFHFSKKGEKHFLNLILPKAEMDLMQYIQTVKPSFDKKLEIMSKIANGLLFMHSQGYFHCDMKASNILMFGDEPKIADFGLSCVKGIEREFSGTPFITSPQGLEKHHIKSSKYSSVYTERLDLLQADIFCLGVTFFTILSEGDNIFTDEFNPDTITEKYDRFISNFEDIFHFQSTRIKSQLYIKEFKSGNRNILSNEEDVTKLYQKIDKVMNLIKCMTNPLQQDRTKSVLDVIRDPIFSNLNIDTNQGVIKSDYIIHKLDEVFLYCVTTKSVNEKGVKIGNVIFDSKTVSLAYSLYLRCQDMKNLDKEVLIRCCFYLASTVTVDSLSMEIFRLTKDYIINVIKHTNGKLRFENEVSFEC